MKNTLQKPDTAFPHLHFVRRIWIQYLPQVNFLKTMILIQELISLAIKQGKTNIPIRVRIAKAERSIENAVLLLSFIIHIGKYRVVTKQMKSVVEKVHVNELQVSNNFIPKIVNSIRYFF